MSCCLEWSVSDCVFVRSVQEDLALVFVGFVFVGWLVGFSQLPKIISRHSIECTWLISLFSAAKHLLNVIITEFQNKSSYVMHMFFVCNVI